MGEEEGLRPVVKCAYFDRDPYEIFLFVETKSLCTCRDTCRGVCVCVCLNYIDSPLADERDYVCGKKARGDNWVIDAGF